MKTILRPQLTLACAIGMLFCVACGSASSNAVEEPTTPTATAEPAAEPAPPAPTTQMVPEGSGWRFVFYSHDDCDPCSEVRGYWPDLVTQAEATISNLTVIEVNCDEPENEEPCLQDEDLIAFPIMFLYPPSGPRIEFNTVYKQDAILKWLQTHVK